VKESLCNSDRDFGEQKVERDVYGYHQYISSEASLEERPEFTVMIYVGRDGIIKH